MRSSKMQLGLLGNMIRQSRTRSQPRRDEDDCVLPANVVSPLRSSRERFLAAARRAAISYLATAAVITFLDPGRFTRPYPLSRHLDGRFPRAPCVHFHPSVSRGLPGLIAEDLVAVHRSVENESTSCREPSWRFASTVPCPAPSPPP